MPLLPEQRSVLSESIGLRKKCLLRNLEEKKAINAILQKVYYVRRVQIYLLHLESYLGNISRIS